MSGAGGMKDKVAKEEIFPYSHSLGLSSTALNSANYNDMFQSPTSMFNYTFVEARRKTILRLGIVFLFGLSFWVFQSHDDFNELLIHQQWQNRKPIVDSDLNPLPAQNLKDLRNATLGVRVDWLRVACRKCVYLK